MYELIVGGIVVGFLASFVSAVFGGGAGLICVPCIYWLLSHHGVDTRYLMQETIATGTFLALPLGVFASLKYYAYGNFDLDALKRYLPFMLLGVVFGAIILVIVSSQLLKSYFGILILIVAVWLLRHRPGNYFLIQRLGLARSLALGVGCISITAGVSVLAVPFLLSCGLELKKAIGTSTIIVLSYCVLAGFIMTIIGLRELGIHDTSFGFLNIPILLSALLPTMLGSTLGARTVMLIPSAILKKIFITLIIIVGFYMLII